MNSRTQGIYLILMSNLFFGFLPIMVKWANVLRYSAIEETFFRFAVGLFGAGVLWAAGWQSLSWVNGKVLLWRGFFGSLSILGYFVALQTTSSGKGTLLNYTYILWANIIAVLFFKQKTPKRFFLYLFLAAVGVELVLGVRWDQISMGDWAGLFSGITGGAAVFAIKKSRETDTALSVFFIFAVFSLVFSGGLLLWGHPLGRASDNLNAWTTPDSRGILILLGMGVVSMVAQVLFSQAMGATSLALGTLLSLWVPVLATLFGWLLLREPLTPHFLIGMLFVLIACGAMILQENQATP